jgi:hypothetical protein
VAGWCPTTGPGPTAPTAAPRRVATAYPRATPSLGLGGLPMVLSIPSGARVSGDRHHRAVGLLGCGIGGRGSDGADRHNFGRQRVSRGVVPALGRRPGRERCDDLLLTLDG